MAYFKCNFRAIKDVFVRWMETLGFKLCRDGIRCHCQFGIEHLSDLIIQILGNVKMDELRVGRILTNHFCYEEDFCNNVKYPKRMTHNMH